MDQNTLSSMRVINEIREGHLNCTTLMGLT